MKLYILTQGKEKTSDGAQRFYTNVENLVEYIFLNKRCEYSDAFTGEKLDKNACKQMIANSPENYLISIKSFLPAVEDGLWAEIGGEWNEPETEFYNIIIKSTED